MDLQNFGIMKLSEMCRICLCQKGTINIYIACHSIRLEKLLNIQFRQGDGLPESICINCEKMLLNAHTFVELCLRSTFELNISVKRKNSNINKHSSADKLIVNAEDADFKGAIYFNQTDDNFDTTEGYNNGFSDDDVPLDKLNRHNYKVKFEFVCTVCNKSFSKKRELRNHEKLDHELLLPCLICNKIFKTKRSLRIHSKIHTGERPHICELCGHQFTQKSGLNRHRLTHGERTFVCSICQAAFKQRSVLVQHLLIHTGERRHCCDLCGVRFTQSGQLLIHMRYKHADTLPERKYKCKLCAKNFALKGSLKRHLKIHEDGLEFPCSECEKRFRTRLLMMNHFKRVHMKKKDFKCDHCVKAFVTKYELIQHMVVHTNIDSRSKGSLFNLKSVQCLQCGLWFATKERLRKHKLVHSNYRKYACELCPRKFYTGTNFRRHLKIHDKK